MALLLDTLNSVDFLRDRGEAVVVRFMVLGRAADYQKGHGFWRAGMPPQGIVVPVSGEAKSTKRGADGREFIDCFTGPGECLGLESAVDGLPHPTDAEVLRAGEFFWIRADSFQKFCNEHPEVRPAITKLLGLRLRRNLQEREDIALRPVSERVAHFLVAHACVRQADGAKVLVEATQSEIAGRLGTVREVVARVFSQFSRLGLIDRTQHGIFITDWDGLRSMAALDPSQPDAHDPTAEYGPAPDVRTARFFLPLAEQRSARRQLDPQGCEEHLDNLELCRRMGCPAPDAKS